VVTRKHHSVTGYVVELSMRVEFMTCCVDVWACMCLSLCVCVLLSDVEFMEGLEYAVIIPHLWNQQRQPTYEQHMQPCISCETVISCVNQESPNTKYNFNYKNVLLK
jgi:hypothetical protein